MICQHYEQYFTVSLAPHLISNNSIGNNSFGLTRTGTIFEVSETILKFLMPPDNVRFEH